MLSPEVASRLSDAAKNEGQYRAYDPVALRRLAEVTFAMMVGPSKMGKTTVIEAMTHHAGFKRVGGFVTRPPRQDDDPNFYRHIPHDDEHLSQLLDKIDSGQLVQYFQDPNLGYLYGTELQDYQGEVCLKDIFASSVPSLRMKFPHSLTLGIVTEPEAWVKRINSAYPHASEQRTARLKEAVSSLEFLTNEPSGNVLWVANHDGFVEDAARDAIELIRNPSRNDLSIKRYALACLEAARTLS